MISFAFLGILCILLLTAYIFLPFFPAFVWALVVYLAGLPLQRRLLRRYSAMKTALFMLVIVILTIIIPISLLGSKLVIEASTAYQKLAEQGITAPSAESFLRLIDNLPLPTSIRAYIKEANLKETFLVHAAEMTRMIFSFSSSFLTNAAIHVGNFLFSVLAFLFLYFYTCLEGEEWYRKIIRAVPSVYGLESLLARLAACTSGLFWGEAGTCLTQGITGGIIFLLLGLPSPLLITALISFCALVPVIGTAIIWGPFAIWLLMNGAWLKALILTLSGIFLISSMDNIIRPFLTKISGSLLSTLTVTIGAIGGIIVFGLTGLVIGPLAIESFSWLLDRLGKENDSLSPSPPGTPDPSS